MGEGEKKPGKGKSMNSDKPKSRFNARVVSSRDTSYLTGLMEGIRPEPYGITRMIRKAVHYVVKLQGVRTPPALILKEDMLAKGGDCTIHRDAITNKVERADCLLMGTAKNYALLTADLRLQPFGLGRLAEEIEEAIANYERESPAVPGEDLPEPVKSFFAKFAEKTLVMGILNVTEDSFSDGGSYSDPNAAVEHALRMEEDGADVIDLGGESSRPGSDPVSADEEKARVLPVIEALVKKLAVPISVDTYKPDVARAALDAGAHILNDISGFSDPAMRELAAEKKVPSVIMHMQGTPKTMQENPTYGDVVSEVMGFLRERTALLVEAGLPEEFVIVDPGIGFGKTSEHNLEIIRNLADFKSLGRPVLMGVSKKHFIGKALGGLPVDERCEGTAAAVAVSIANGANIVRVHDVKEMSRVAKVADAITGNG